MKYRRTTSSWLACLILLLMSCSESSQPVLPDELVGEYVITDPDDVTGTPDFRQLDITVTDLWVHFRLTTWNDLSKEDGTHFLYMYSINRESIRFRPDSFLVVRDSGFDGHFETLLTRGLVYPVSAREFKWSVPRFYFSDLNGKEVWLYSMFSLDRLPDNGRHELEW